MHQRVVSLARFHDHVASFASITPGGPAPRDELLPPESEAAVAPVAGFDSDCGFVDEHGRQVLGLRS
jgi:hypothetical protein